MALATPQDQFDRGKPFFPLVAVYTMGLHGFKELAVRGVLDIAHERTGSPTVDQALDAIRTGDDDLDTGIRKLREPLSLLVACDGTRIKGPVGVTARELAEHHQTILPTLLPALGSVLMLAHEIVTDQLTEAERQEPLPQFLRHVRNAVAHNGSFEFRPRPKDPRSQPNISWTAAWGNFVLSIALQGSRLFKDAAGNGLLGPGDPIRLLWDIEQKYPSLKA